MRSSITYDYSKDVNVIADSFYVYPYIIQSSADVVESQNLESGKSYFKNAFTLTLLPTEITACSFTVQSGGQTLTVEWSTNPTVNIDSHPYIFRATDFQLTASNGSLMLINNSPVTILIGQQRAKGLIGSTIGSTQSGSSGGVYAVIKPGQTYTYNPKMNRLDAATIVVKYFQPQTSSPEAHDINFNGGLPPLS